MSTTTTEAPAPSADPFPLVLPGRIRPVGDGWKWIAQGWRLFARSPVMWIVALLLFLVIAFALMLVPFVGHIALHLLSPVFGAGLMLACAALETRGDFELGELFGGFRNRLGSLVVVGILLFLGEIAIFLVFMAIVGFGLLASILGAMVSGETTQALHALIAASTSILLASLVALALFVPLIAAYWFAPALVAMHGMGPGAAMMASLSASLRNFLPFLLYGFVMMILAILAAIPFGLGYLVFIPLTITSTYASYRAIFTQGEIELAR
ncbi:MAG TPA: BPSS1780 family membrane protein [Usitatibacter sp.]|jgi:uncharacterized membrane protein|nr:BPSS1780 family membrane protein [Usitatibacter sp.]